jgi:hypothetical protein
MPKPFFALTDIAALFRPSPIVRVAETDRPVLLLWVRVPHRLNLHPGYGDGFLATAEGTNGYRYYSSEWVQVKYLVGNPYNTITYGTGARGIPVAQEEEILALPVACYPQRESRFAVDLFQDGGREPLATFQIANFNTDRPTPFAPDHLPVTRQEQNLKVTLDSITSVPGAQYVRPDGSRIWWSKEGEPKGGVLIPGQEGRQRLTLAYNYRGQPDTDWKISELEAFDAAGNRTSEMAPAPNWPCQKYFPPSIGEPYKLKIGVDKTWNNHFDSDELWTVNDIPLPTRGKPVKISGEFRRNDLHLQLVSVYGMDGKNFNPDLAIVRIKIEASSTNPVLLVHVEDEKGRTVIGPWGEDVLRLYGPGLTGIETGNITIFHTGYIGDNDRRYRSIPLKIPKGVKRLKLVFKLPRIHFFEFSVPAYQRPPR